MVWFHPTDDMQAGVNANMLRPEVLESIFYMYRLTGDPMYQQWAWRIFQAFERYSKLETGYAGIEVINALLVTCVDTWTHTCVCKNTHTVQALHWRSEVTCRKS